MTTPFPRAIYTIGHSTRTLDEFVGLLQHNAIDALADIRTIPRSRHNPQFNGDTLERTLNTYRISYLHLKELGGLRHPRAGSPNTGWQNDSFRGFADYMQTPEFAVALERLMNLARDQSLVIMCAEAVPWRCHRFLVGDALLVHGVAVQHIITRGSLKLHALSPLARVQGTRIYYP